MSEPTPTADLLKRGAGHGRFDDLSMLLIESLLHGLIAKSVLSIAEVIEIISIAADTRQQLSLDRGEASGTRDGALEALGAIIASLQIDLGKQGGE